MFGFVQWDSPFALLLEVLLALAVFIVLFWIARRLERQQRERDSGSLPLQAPPHDGHLAADRDDQGSSKA